jgi:hypothetical protein
MSDLYVFNAGSSADLAKALDEFGKRGELILEHVFHKSYDVRLAFRGWFTDLAHEHENADLILHDEPLYLVAEYIGFDVTAIQGSSVERDYQQLAQKYHW